jgi:hypothetical protein
MPESTSRLKFVTYSSPEMGINPRMVSQTAVNAHAIPEQERDEQTALIKSRIQVTDEEIAALPDRVRQRMAAAFGWLPKYGAPSTGYRTASAMVTDGHPGFAPRPKVLLTRNEREQLERAQVTDSAQVGLVTSQAPVGLPRPQVVVNKRDRR